MELDERLLRELEALGFSKDQATEAIRFGNSNIEAAVNWIVDHENDTSASAMPTQPEVPVNINIEDEPFQISEYVKLRAQELRNQARKRKTEQEKKSEREREKERIRTGKEMMEIKGMAEERERKRFLAQRKAEKEEERRARERILQKLQQDKLERKGMLGMSREGPIHMKPSTANTAQSNVQNLSSLDPDMLPVKPANKREVMGECLRALKRRNKEDEAKAKTAFQTLFILVKNVVNHPDDVKYRKIRISNPIFQDRVGKFEEGIKFLELCGFERLGEGGDFLFLAKEKMDMNVLILAGTELQNALTNPFFGLLSK